MGMMSQPGAGVARVQQADNLNRSYLSNSSSIESKRPKERTIAHILDTVHKWRKYYAGYTDRHGVYKKLKL